VLEREGAGDWQHRRGAPEQPRERELRRRGATSLGDPGKRAATVAVEGEVGNEHDVFAGAVVDDVLVPALGEVVLVLDRSDRDDLAGTLDLGNADLGEATRRILPLSR
jgi:hypothetical protein